MVRQTLVIGLGQFGAALARALMANGGEVLAVDTRAEKVADLAPEVTSAVCLDAMDEEALAKLAPHNRDVCVCAIGDESREASIIVTALLRQLGAPHIIARATDDLHSRILSLVGAHEVINPERSFGDHLAQRLAWKNVLNVVALDNELSLTELLLPESMVGRRLSELTVFAKSELIVSAIRREVEGRPVALLPDPSKPLLAGDVLLLIGRATTVRQLAARV